MLVTLLAAYLPARKAARVPPVAAMRDDVAIPESSMRRRLIGGAALTVLGAGLMIWALAFDGGLQPLGGGVLAVFVGVALLSPVISRPIIAVDRRRLSAAVRHGRAAGQGERPAQSRGGPRRPRRR